MIAVYHQIRKERLEQRAQTLHTTLAAAEREINETYRNARPTSHQLALEELSLKMLRELEYARQNPSVVFERDTYERLNLILSLLVQARPNEKIFEWE